ncbi:MAG: MFS transporter [Anaerolineaceae bacterium]
MDTEKIISEKKRASVLATYASRIKAFSRNARLYLLSEAVYGTATGIFALLFNFYALSLGYNEAALGNMVAARSMTALIMALPCGFLTDKIGRRNSILLSIAGYSASVALILLFPSTVMMYAINIVQGLSQSLSGVAMGPYLMENSEETERTYLFSISSGMRMTATSIGQWIGGYLPTWFALRLAISAMDTKAYSLSLWTVALGSLAALLPMLLVSTRTNKMSERSTFAPLSFIRKNPGKFQKLILPTLVTSIGAGLIMPFMNVFFRNVHMQTDTSIGVIFAWGSLAMGIGLMIAPALAERFGKIQVVVISQALSVPFLVMLGFAPWFGIVLVAYYARTMLMNMSSPIYSTYVMEQVDPESRGMLASLTSMATNFGWALSPTISGYLQVRYGFGPSFMLTIVLYSIAITMYYIWFWRPDRQKKAAVSG